MSNPIINIISRSVPVISRKEGSNSCTIVFTSDQNLTEWEARADGTGPGTGLLVGSGTSLTAETEQSFYVDSTELDTETYINKTYRINVYGKNSSGEWSLYE